MMEQPMTEDEYYDNAAKWGEDRYHSAVKWNQRLILLSGALLLITIVSVLTMISLFPLKENVPFLVEKNTVTGEISVPQKINPDEFNSQWMVDQSFIWKYLKARERFVNLEQEEADYTLVQILSSPDANEDFIAFYEHSEGSKPNTFKQGDKRRLHVKAIVPLEEGRVQVHWKAEDFQKKRWQTDKHYISTLSYSYSEAAVPSQPHHRLENMVGFQVTEYHRELAVITE